MAALTVHTRVLHAFATFGIGGPQLRMAGFINWLGPCWEHTILAMDGAYAAASHLLCASCRTLDGQVAPGRVQARSLPGLIRGAVPDVVITYSWGAIEALICTLAVNRLPAIHHEHGFNFDEAHGLKRRRALLRRLVLNRAFRTIVPSKSLMAVALERYGVRPAKLRLIANGVDVLNFQPAHNPELRTRWGASESNIVFGFLGRLGREKDLGFLLRAFAAARVENALLALIGDGPCRPQLEALAAELGVAGRVRFCGAASDTASYYAALDAFVMSSVSEQMPMSLLEAMACGLPAFCTAVGDTAEMLAGDSAALVAQGDLGAYIEGLRRIAADRDLRSRMGERNRRRAVETYSAERMYQAWRDEVLAAAETGRGRDRSR